MKVLIIVLVILFLIGKFSKKSPSSNSTPKSSPPASHTTPATRQSHSRSAVYPSISYTPMYTIERPRSKKRLLELQKGGYVVFDTETTGLNAQNNKIIELALLRCDTDGTITRFSSLFNPKRSLDSTVQRITGLSDPDLACAPLIEERLDHILSFIGDLPLVAHNAYFDGNFLSAELEAAGMHAEFSMIDTLWMSRQAFPGMPNYKLATLIEHFKLSDSAQSHRAMGDVECTKKLFDLCLKELIHKKEIESAARKAAKAAKPQS